MIASEIMLPPHAPEIYLDRATLWNAVESCEKHPKAQLAYSFDIAMQNELTLEENMELARKFVQEQFVAKGMIADLAFHSPEKEDGGIPNPHFHVMTTMRPLNPDGTWGQKQRREYLLDEDGNRIRDKNGDYVFNAVHTTDWHEPETLEHWREQWAAAVNTKFEEKGLDVHIDHRSYVRQGLDQIPTVHEGANVRQMEAKGIRTEKEELNRWIEATNRFMQDVRKKIKALFGWMAEVKEELSKPQTPNLADLLIAYCNQRNAGAWSNKARTGNLKQFAEAVNYLMENKLSIADMEHTIHTLEQENVSFVRIGKGEIALMQGKTIAAQQYHEELAKRLKHILRLRESGLCVGIPYYYIHPQKNLNPYIEIHSLSIADQRRFLFQHCPKDINYLDSCFTQAYHIYQDYDFEGYYS